MVLASPQAITEALVAARYSQATELSTFSLTTDSSGAFQMLSVDRPTILWPYQSQVTTTQITGTVTVNNGGTGYAIGDILTVAQGTGRLAVVQVLTLTATAVATVGLVDAGAFNSSATAAGTGVLTTAITGGGSGCTLNVSACGAVTTTSTHGSSRVIEFGAARVPLNSNFTMRSRGAGVVYLPNPGRYWLRANQDTNETVKVDFVCIDATDPAVAGRYMGESGCHRIKTNAVVRLPAIATNLLPTLGQILPANRNRTGVLIASVAGSAAANPAVAHFRLAFGDTSTTLSAAISQLYGWSVGASPNTTFSTFGEATWKGPIAGCISLAASGGSTAYGAVQVIEWE
jgi:hypothetical protein